MVSTHDPHPITTDQITIDLSLAQSRLPKAHPKTVGNRCCCADDELSEDETELTMDSLEASRLQKMFSK